jgi:hypothetical protein
VPAARAIRIEGMMSTAVGHDDRNQDIAKPDDRPNRKVDPGRNNDDRHPDGHNADNCNLTNEVGEVVERQKARRRKRENDKEGE